MTDPQLTWIAFLLDRSGSMQSIKTDIEGGFAAFIDEQRKATGRCAVTLGQFDNTYDVVYQDLPLSEVPPLDLQPRGGTALLDAVGRLVTDTGQRLAALPEDRRPGSVVVAIMTDGMENASSEWTHPAIKSLIDQQTSQYDWQFLFMGADQDAIEVGAQMGISRDHAVTYTRENASDVMASASANVAAYRGERAVHASAAMPEFTDQQRKRATRKH